jgi:hypothetical protein
MSYIGKTPTSVPLTSSDITDGIITTTKIADSSVTTEKIVADTNFRNIIINGDMSINQRSTSVSSITGSGYNTVDRWHIVLSGLGTWTQSQSTDVPTGQGFATSLKMDCTTADASPAAGDFLFFNQRVEGQNVQYLKKGTSSAESTTLSFWVKSNKTGTYICELDDNDNTRNINKSYTINSANTWEKKTITYAGDTTGAFGNDNGNSLQVIWWLGAGSTYSSGTLNNAWEGTTNANRAVGQVNLADSTSNEWYVTGVQLETGTTASDFEFLPVDVNLQRCQRYYYVHAEKTGSSPQIGIGAYTTSTRFDCSVFYPTTMRSVPSLISTSSANTYYIYGQADFFDGMSLGGTTTVNSAQLVSGVNTSGTFGQAGHLSIEGTGGIIAFNSEL